MEKGEKNVANFNVLNHYDSTISTTNRSTLNEEGVKFRPVRGLDNKIQEIEYNDGYIYFATDSGKIYIDANNQNKVLMGGGGTSLVYAYDTTVEEKPGEIYILSLDTIEDSSNLKPGDLIINEANGCFYKVSVINYGANTVQCSLIAVSGTGGGGGGSSSGGQDTTLTLTVTNIAARKYYVYGQPAYIYTTPIAQLSAVVNITYEVIGTNGTKVHTEEVRSGDTHTFDIGSMLYEGLNDVRVYAQTDNDGETRLTYSNCRAVKMALISDITESDIATVHNGQIEVYVIPIGEGLDKVITVSIDGAEVKGSGQTVFKSGERIPISLPGQPHGHHTINITMHAVVNGVTIPVPPLEYEMAWIEPEKTNPIIWFGKIPEKVTNYSVVQIPYMVYDPSYPEGREFEIELRKEFADYSPRKITYNSKNMLMWNISDYSVGKNNYGISRGGRTRDFEFEIEADTSRDLNVLTTGLYLNLDSTGRSNSEIPSIRQTWNYTNNLSPSKSFEARLNNFNWYNNGWIEDENGISVLRVSNGASVEIPLDSILKQQKLGGAKWTFEFRFKVRNVTSYKTLVNITGSAESEETESNLSSDFQQNTFIDYYSGAGLCLGPSDVFFAGGDELPNVRYKADEIINCSIVIDSVYQLIYIYINGIMSKVISCTEDNFKIGKSVMTISSQACDVDIYKIRIYQIALDHSDIVKNYIADQKDVTLYDANNITRVDENNNKTIDLIGVQTYNANNKTAPLMPYAILKVNDDKATNDLLPFIKDEIGDGIRCDVTFINSPLDAAYANKSLEKDAIAAGMSVADYYEMHAPSFQAIQAWVNVQGTSSQGYPRRNYKIKFKKSTSFKMHKGPFENLQASDDKNKSISKIKLDDPIGENAVTWKADYMESSGTHNTGFTSYVKTLYSKHPLQDYYADAEIENLQYLRTTIYGFPMMVFQEHQDGSYEYIGKYNFNYDKSCPNVIGFECKNDHPFVSGQKMKDVAECWEFCNNKGTRCSFTQVDFDEVTEDTYDEEGNFIPGGALTVLKDFEIRYHPAKDDVEEWILNQSAENNIRILEKYENLRILCDWLYNLQTNPIPGAKNDFKGELSSAVIYDGVTYTEDNADYRLAKFKAEFEQHFDLEYCLIYFIMTELLVAYDSRGKNMMLASWGPKQVNGEYIWYPIFYDVDTQLGINNSGVPLWDYNVNPTDNQVFSTPDSVLWNNFYASYLPRIRTKYADLRSKNLNFNQLNGYYDYDPLVSKSYAMQGIRPYVAYNADEYFKYIAPARTGYITTKGTVDYTDTYYYCAQGTRELQRELFLTNRFYYLDSKWRGGYFNNTNKSDLVQLRVNYNATDFTSDKEVGNDNYPGPYDVPPYFSLTPFLNSYPSFYVDDSFVGGQSIAQAGMTVNVKVPETLENIFKNTELTTNKGQLIYLGGKEYLSDIGDLSKYYLDEIDLQGLNKLTKLTLGSDLEEYRNDFFIPGSKIIFDKTDGYPLLKEVNFSNLHAYNSNLKFLQSEKLKEFRGLGSGITSIDFADGVQLTTCYLPASITSLKLTKATSLTNLLEATPYYNTEEKKWPTGLYIEGLTNKLELNNYENETTKINTFYMVGGNLKTESYRLLDTITKIKLHMLDIDDDTLIKDFSIHATELQWSPYVLVEHGESYDSTLNYYQLTDHYTFIDYIYKGSKEWNADTLNEKVFIQTNDPTTSPINNLDLLDVFIQSYNGEIPGDYFHDSTGNNNTLPYLSGSIYVNNSIDNPINEVAIKNYYNKYYPDLKIYVNEVSEALTINYIEVKDADSGEEYVWEVQKYNPKSTDKVTPIETTVTKTDYNFLGWSLSKTAEVPDAKQPTDYTAQEIAELEQTKDNVLNFYAVFTIHKYKFTFYNYDGSSLNNTDESEVLYIPAGEPLYAPTGVVPYRNDSELGKYQTYDFKGYSLSKNNIGSVVQLSNIKSNRDLVFYAHFEQITDVRNIIHPEYFTAVDSYYSESGRDWEDTSFAIDNGVILKLVVPVKGKITIPAQFEGKPVIALDSSFSSSTNLDGGGPGLGDGLTYIFFQEGTLIREFQQYAFTGNQNLIEVEYPKSLRQIGDSCFRNCPKIIIPNNYIGNNIVKIGKNCYTASGKSYSTPITDLNIGESVVVLDYGAFAYLSRAITNLWLGSKEKPSKIDFSYTNTGTGGKKVFLANQNTPISAIYFYSGGRYTKVDFQDNYCGENNVTVADVF